MPPGAEGINFLKTQLDASLTRIHLLEKENQELRQEVLCLKDQVVKLKAHDVERRTILWKKLQKPLEVSEPLPATDKSTTAITAKAKGDHPENALKNNGRAAALQEPPARPNKESCGSKLQPASEPPAPTRPPPPPPPPPSKINGRSRAVRRVPEVMELYRSLMKREFQKDNKSSTIASVQDTNPRSMIGEIENRSTYLLSIKSDVETHGEFVKYLSREVERATFTEISEVESFVRWLDGELSCLVDERAVLKHFPQWPERKADALREAACSYRELKKLEAEVLSFKDNPKQQLNQTLRKMQALQDRLERSISNIERVRQGTSKRYKEFHVPWDWMSDTGVLGRLKLSSLTLVRQLMERISKSLQGSEQTHDEDLLLQGVRFAYRVHQFAGGFDPETTRAFEDLKKNASRYTKE